MVVVEVATASSSCATKSLGRRQRTRAPRPSSTAVWRSSCEQVVDGEPGAFARRSGPSRARRPARPCRSRPVAVDADVVRACARTSRPRRPRSPRIRTSGTSTSSAPRTACGARPRFGDGSAAGAASTSGGGSRSRRADGGRRRGARRDRAAPSASTSTTSITTTRDVVLAARVVGGVDEQLGGALRVVLRRARCARRRGRAPCR